MTARPAPPDLLRDELARQGEILNREAPLRFVATLLGFCVAAIYLPAWFVLAMMLGDLAGEVISFRLFRKVDALAREAWRRQAVVAATFAMEFCFVLPPAVLWHLDDPYAKALAVGLAAGTMMHMATARSIHLPVGLAGALALSLVLTGSNTLFWARQEAWVELAVTSVCIVVTIGYFVMAAVSNNRLHRTAAASRHAAEEADAAKGRFLAEMSHELRTPLNGILGMADAELRQARDPASQARLSVLVESASSLNMLLSDILDLSAVQEGRMAIRPRVLIPAEEIRASAALFGPAAEAAGIAIEVAIDPALLRPALIDGQRLRQCLSNLLSNAIRHGTSATRIALRAGVEEGDGPPLLAVEVEDDGPGLPAARPGPGGSLAGEGKSRGHGLGLSIARGLAAQMGGNVVVVPVNGGGRGACFRLTMLLPPAPVPPASVPPPPRTGAEGLSGLRVLVVDDVPTNRLVAMTYLRHLGATAAEVGSGAEALHWLQGHTADAVLLDMNMPDMDGLQTFRLIRALPSPNGRAAVIALTADALDHQRAHFLAEGLDGYLAKPVTAERIAAEVRRTMALQPTA